MLASATWRPSEMSVHPNQTNWPVVEIARTKENWWWLTSNVVTNGFSKAKKATIQFHPATTCATTIQNVCSTASEKILSITSAICTIKLIAPMELEQLITTKQYHQNANGTNPTWRSNKHLVTRPRTRSERSLKERQLVSANRLALPKRRVEDMPTEEMKTQRTKATVFCTPSSALSKTKKTCFTTTILQGILSNQARSTTSVLTDSSEVTGKALLSFAKLLMQASAALTTLIASSSQATPRLRILIVPRPICKLEQTYQAKIIWHVRQLVTQNHFAERSA